MSDYAAFHRNRVNLVVHLVAVPGFVLGVLLAAWWLLSGSWTLAAGALALAGLSMAAQGWGHSLEADQPQSFASAGDGLRRIFTEQFVTFPVFLLSGGWLRAWHHSGSPHPD